MDSKVRNVPRQVHQQAKEVLQVLFGLLEEYAPSWYTEELRDKAQAALRSPQDGMSERASFDSLRRQESATQ